MTVPARALLLTPLLVALLAAPLRAQAPSLRVGETRLTAALHRGHPALPADALRNLGASLTQSPEGVRVVLFGDTLVLHTLSPFFTVDGRLEHLSHAVYQESGVVYLPFQFFVEWLPARYSERVTLASDALRLRAGDAPARAAAPPRRAPSEPAPLGRQAPSQDDTRVVIIDAGHGGRDNGAVGPGGIREKDVTLAIAMRLAQQLQRKPGYEVHLTRTTDTLIALFDRPKLANQWKDGRPAALFVSIHANSHSNRAVHGFETFFLSEARTADERAVAERENAVARYDGEEALKGTDDLAVILSSLRNEFYVRASAELASTVQQGLSGFHSGPNRGVKQAPFVVLVGAYMPAVLVETAFVSHPRESRLLVSSQFQENVAYALAQAVERFFEEHEALWRQDQT